MALASRRRSQTEISKSAGNKPGLSPLEKNKDSGPGKGGGQLEILDRWRVKVCRAWGNQPSGSLGEKHSRRSEQQREGPGVGYFWHVRGTSKACVAGRTRKDNSR